MADVLSEIYVSGQFVQLLVYLWLLLACGQYLVPRLSTEMLIVEAGGDAVAFEQREALIPREAHHSVLGVEM